LKVKCPICGIEGYLQERGNSVRVSHYIGYQGKISIIQWHVVGKELVKNQENCQETLVNNKPFSATICGNNRGKSLNWSLRRDLDPRPLPYQGAQIIEPMSFRAFNWLEFKKYVQNKYRKTTAKRVMCYANRYYTVLESGNIGQLNAVPSTTRSEVIKSLIRISKYTGCYEQFKAALKSYGIKSARPDALAAFVRIYNNNNNNLDEWFAKVKPILTPQENLLLKFLSLTGLRCSEGIESFNLIIELSGKGRLHEYLSAETGILEHFRYKEKFLRGTKNAFVSIVPEALVDEIAGSQRVTYAGLTKKLQRRKISTRISELRDFYGTFMIRHGLVAQEADLLCGRIPPSIFVRHYFSPAIRDLRDRTLKGLREMEPYSPE